MFEIVVLDEATSTNIVAAQMAPEGRNILVAARCQTAGRGQRGNSWESEPGKNISASLLWFPEEFKAGSQFSISEAVALAVVDLLAENGIDSKVKWPNDIYAGDKKICGILIEHSVTGMLIDHSVAGVGINVNQIVFLSDAPNPVSMAALAAREFNVEGLLERFARLLEKRLGEASEEACREELHAEFLRRMWRFDGCEYPFRDVASGVGYQGVIKGVDRRGILEVYDKNSGKNYFYMFKEVEFLLK